MARPLLAAGLLAALPLLGGAARGDVPLVPGKIATVPYVSPADGAARSYDIRVPAGWDGRSRLPAVLLLHGRGGTRRQFELPGYQYAADAKGAVLVFWEGRIVPGGSGYPTTEYVDGADRVPDETDVLACLDDALARAPIDPNRVALIGTRSLDTDERALLKDLKAAVFTMSDLDRDGIEQARAA